mgnify:CR=1 FL=1
MMEEVKYPNCTVELSDGNAFAIMGAAQRAAKRAGVPRDEIDAYLKEAQSGDYDNLLQVTMKWFDVA